MASAEVSRRVERVVRYPPLSELDDLQPREFHEGDAQLHLRGSALSVSPAPPRATTATQMASVPTPWATGFSRATVVTPSTVVETAAKRGRSGSAQPQDSQPNSATKAWPGPVTAV